MLSIGSNFGDKEANIENALDLLITSEAIKFAKFSSFYETEPYGVTEQEWFLNMSIAGYTDLSPQELLVICKSIEYSVGRCIRKRWHEREIDIDILLYDNDIIQEKDLTIPHPRLEKRKFVLIPCNEIEPNYIHPQLNMTMKQLLDECSDSSEVKLYA